jgi:hypothetical protein
MTESLSLTTTSRLIDADDLATVRQLYTESQNWTRHYEQLVVNANVLIVSASLIFVGLAFGDKISGLQASLILAVPILMSLVGLGLTETLFKLYASCILRLVRLENLMGCYDASRFDSIDRSGPLLPREMLYLPGLRPTSVKFFLMLHSLLMVAYLCLLLVK